MSKSPSLRRIKADIRELSIDPSDQYHAAPLEHDMFEWHFTIRGAEGTDFAGGVYHGRILLPPEYPFKPPDILFLTPSGRFECGVKVCLSFSAHHPELWQPAWGIRLILEALISFLPTPADGAIGALDWTAEERRKLAVASVVFRCPVCCEEGEACADLLPELKAKGDGGDDGGGAKSKKTKFQEEIEKLKLMQFQNHAFEEEEGTKRDGDGGVEDSPKSESAEGAAAEEKKQSPSQSKSEDADADPKSLPPDSLPEPDPKPVEEKSNQSLQGAATSQPDSSPPPKASEQRATDNNNTKIEPRNVPLSTPPVPEPSAQAATETLANTTPPAATTVVVTDNNNNDNNAPVVSDSVLNMMIGFFSVIVIALLRQSQSLMGELHGLEDEN